MDFSFDSIKQRFIENLSKENQFAELMDYSSLNIIGEIFSKEVNELANYFNYQNRELRWMLAKNITSLITQAQNLNNYEVKRKVSARGQVTFTASSDGTVPVAESVTIPKYTVISSIEDSTVKVCTLIAESFPQGEIKKVIDVIQGIPLNYNFLAKGDLFEEITISNPNLDNDVFEVFVDNVLYTKVKNLINSVGTDTHYELRNADNFSGVILKFGNGIFGKKLQRGQEIIFKGIETLGLDGNIPKRNVLTKIETPLLDINSTPVTLFAKNESSIAGGENAEDKESIRANAPQAFQTGDRASSGRDYLKLLKDHPAVFKANVWGEYEYLIDKNLNPGDQTAFVPLQENKVHICAFKSTGDNLSSIDKSDIISYLNDLKAPTDIIEYNDPEVVFLYFVSKIFIKDRSFSLATVKSGVTNKLLSTYSIGAFEFGNSIFESDYKGTIDSVDGVDHNLTKIRVVNYFKFDQAISCSFNLSLYPVKKSTIQNASVKVYISAPDTPTNFIYVGQDSLNGSGSFSPDLSNPTPYFNMNGSTIEYSNGEGIITIAGTGVTGAPYGSGQTFTNFNLRMEYEIEDVDFVLKKRNQIFRYEKSDIDVVYMS